MGYFNQNGVKRELEFSDLSAKRLMVEIKGWGYLGGILIAWPSGVRVVFFWGSKGGNI